jgi:hypothetical protein
MGTNRVRFDVEAGRLNQKKYRYPLAICVREHEASLMAIAEDCVIKELGFAGMIHSMTFFPWDLNGLYHHDCNMEWVHVFAGSQVAYQLV